MKLPSSILLATLAFSSSSSSSSSSKVEAAYGPVRVPYETLQQGNAQDVLLQALQDVGMISITKIPRSFARDKAETLQLLPKCMNDLASLSNSDDIDRTASALFVLERTFGDGTLRRTFAAHKNTNAETTSSSFEFDGGDDRNHPSCNEFGAVSESFRETVGTVIQVFAKELASALHLDGDDAKPLLQKDAEGEAAGDLPYNLENIVGLGEHLEHFHCYYKNNTQHDDDDDDDADDDVMSRSSRWNDDTTIEWHTDQGLILAFAPGLIDGETTDGFYIQLKDGTTEMVTFDQSDDLVFVLGDGVHQYLNDVLVLEKQKPPLRALPHALKMPATAAAAAATTAPRVWYGRMVLPPANAKHPVHGKTFGEIRKGMMTLAENSNSDMVLANSMMGCSHNLVARELQETTCEEGTEAYCWHRCMNLTDYNVSEEICEEQNKTLACMNDEGFLWPYIHDPQFKLGCASPDAANWTVVTDDSSGHGNGDDDKNHTTNAGGEDDPPTADPADSTRALFLGASFLLGSTMTAFFSVY